jgi:oligoendopeptidase F
MSTTERQTWDLEAIFAGGTSGLPFLDEMAAVEAVADALVVRGDAVGEPGQDDNWTDLLLDLLAAEERAGQLAGFAHCHSAAAALDPAVGRALSRVEALFTRLQRAWSRPTDRIARCDEAGFAALCALPRLVTVRPMLDDMRPLGRLLLPAGEQALASELAQDAIHAWGQRYNQISATIVVETGGETLSAAQASNLLFDPDPAVREGAGRGLQAAWANQADGCADALSHIVGWRATIARRLGVSPVDEALTNGRISRPTLDALMAACATARPLLWRFLAAKARLLGRDQLHFWDLAAPVGKTTTKPSWQDAQNVVLSRFGAFSPRMQSFVQRALDGGWIEAEDRGGKRPGAFCTDLPKTAQSRVFMTYGQSTHSLLTLAHELGHAYHNEVLSSSPPAQRRLPNTLAETASTFGEALVRGAALEDARGTTDELALLDGDLTDAATFLLNIPLRYDFEALLYELRSKGALDPKQLDAHMTALHRTWYGPALGEVDASFWSRKLHFFLSWSPFYNFPYTFGYLFSGLVYARARQEGPAWADGYDRLLSDTGAGPAEAVARKHLGVDLTDPDCWTPTLQDLERRVARYLELAATA